MTHSGEACADGLQQVVDVLATRLGRSVAVDDTHGRLVVASRHFGDEDPLRTYAVMQRRSDPRVIDHFAAHDIHRWSAPGRVPPAADIDFKARVCCPVLGDGIRFGHLFLIDDGVAAWEVDLAAAAADRIGRLLHRRLILHEEDGGHREALARDLVGPDPDARAVAARALHRDHLVEAVEPALALCVQVLPPATGPAPGSATVDPGTALRVALDRVVRADPDRTLTTATGRSASMLLLGSAATVDTGRDRAHRLVGELGDGPGAGRVVVGLGSVRDGADAAHRSHDEARAGAEAAALVPTLGEVVGPDDLGAYPLLLALPRHRSTAELVPASLRRLLEQDPQRILVDTLEAYLDRCGDATATAAALHVHRSTLYYRLGRIGAITEVDLHDGRHRLALHLGLKLRHVLDARDDHP